MTAKKKASTGHVHAIPDIGLWSERNSVGDDGEARHVCYFCRPNRYEPMPANCTLCARCGVFMWTGIDDAMNAAMLVCDRCESELASEHEATR